jgi:ribosomal biogenesis protein LAS1
LPSLAELKRAAIESLEWLWKWYWAQLDHAFKPLISEDEGEELGIESRQAVRERLQAILKTYIKDRKSEIKRRDKGSTAASTALSSYNLRFSSTSTTTPSPQTQRLLLQLLVDEKMILPTDKKLGSTMSGAFLIWTPFFLTFTSESAILPIPTLIEHLIKSINVSSASRAMVNPEMDPIKEGLHDWILHMLTSPSTQSPSLETVLSKCFSDPTFWNLRIAAGVLEKGSVPNKHMWSAVLDAARREGEEMDVEMGVEGIEKALPAGKSKVEVNGKEKIKGPTKVLGMWKPKPVGWLPEGWENDE